MQANTSPEPAQVKSTTNLSRIWLIPLVALAIGLWMLYFEWQNQGTLITIEFEQATGLEAGKTVIRTRDVDVGEVKTIELKEDLSGVIVTARIAKGAEDLLTENTEFWIVRPRVSLSGVSGLSTLMSGPYINMAASKEGASQEEFVALSNPPVTPPGTPGLHITLNSDDEFAFKEGDPIVYKGLKVGEFEDIYFNLEERIVYYNVFIEAPYHKLITSNTKFWNVSGVGLKLDATGIQFDTGSVETLLTNGVTFGVPEGLTSGEIITERAYFDIYPDYETASKQRYKLGAEFALLIEDTVRGLNVGAPVEYRGLVVGEVVEINPLDTITRDILDDAYPIPVIITIQPGRLNMPDNETGLEYIRKQTLHWVERGFRASLKTGNILTGALYVDLQLYPDLPDTELSAFQDYDVIPTISGEFAQITEKVTQILDKFNNLPLDQVVDNTNTMLTQFTETMQTFKVASEQFYKVGQTINNGEVIDSMNLMLQNISKLTADYAEGSASHAQINQTMRSLQQLMNDLQPLLKQLNKSPNSLIFPSRQPVDQEPKGAR